MSVREAIEVIAVKSANDVAVALAERIAGSERAFVKQMNAKAKALGMARTHFANASGLPDRRNVSTARDLARLGLAMIREHPRRYAVFDQTSTRFKGRLIHGHNRLIRQPGIDGMKTGYINASGFNVLTSGVRDGHRVVAVVLDGSSAAARDRYMGRLMNASFTAAGADAAHPMSVAGLLGETSAEPAGAAIEFASLPRKAQPGGEWRIQVGAFATAEASAERLKAVSRRHPEAFNLADARTSASGDLFLARFAAASRQEAQDACAILARDGEECLAIVRTP